MSNWLKVESTEQFPLSYDEGRGVWMPFEYNGEYLVDVKAKNDLEQHSIPFTEVERVIIEPTNEE